jgi:DNA-binding XRE family transcriptional regulator
MPDHLEIARLISAARRRLGLTQSELARKANCRQSAVSMFERGHANALARPKIDLLLNLLEIELPADDRDMAPPAAEQSAAKATSPRYCPVFDCPSNVPFVVLGTLLLKPQIQPAYSARHCAFCGELLEDKCPECGASANSGACCSQCGSPYISTPPELAADSPSTWAANQRARLMEIGLLRP